MSEQVQWVGILELFNVMTMRRHPAVWVVFLRYFFSNGLHVVGVDGEDRRAHNTSNKVIYQSRPYSVADARGELFWQVKVIYRALSKL